jgi:hypothetical protein
MPQRDKNSRREVRIAPVGIRLLQRQSLIAAEYSMAARHCKYRDMQQDPAGQHLKLDPFYGALQTKLAASFTSPVPL